MSFQKMVARWMAATFSPGVVTNIGERNHRFLEEALELVQAQGCTQVEALMLVNYVYSRPIGEPLQETGGVMVTLAALCNACGRSMDDCGVIELQRCWENIEKIREKQRSKPPSSPLPGASRAE